MFYCFATSVNMTCGSVTSMLYAFHTVQYVHKTGVVVKRVIYC